MSHLVENSRSILKSWQEALADATRRFCRTLLSIIGSPYTTLALLALSLIFTLFMGVPALGKTEPQTAGLSYTQRTALYNEPLLLLTNDAGDPTFPARALLATLIVLCALRAAHELIDAWQLPVPARRLTHSEEFTLDCDAHTAWEYVSHALSTTGHRLTPPTESEGTRRGTARIRDPGRWFTGALYIGLCLLFVAPLLRWGWAWHSPPLHLSLGETWSVKRANVDVTLDQIAFVPRPDGTPRIFDARIAVARGENREHLTVGLDRRARQRGIAFYYLGHGPAVRVSAQDDQGTPLDIQQIASDTSPQHVLRMRFHREQQERLLSIPQANLVLRLVSYRSIPSQDIKDRALQIQALQGSTERVMTEKVLTESGTIHIDDVTLDVRFEYYATLGVKHEPELVAAVLGGILILLGLVGTMICPPHRIWMIMQEDKSRCHHRLTVLKRHAEAPWFLSVKAKLQKGSDRDDA
ncbi:MAG: cytochrome c biogenesis protein ResB [Anaerolineales bacterium]